LNRRTQISTDSQPTVEANANGFDHTSAQNDHREQARRSLRQINAVQAVLMFYLIVFGALLAAVILTA
jgi:uncharacterized membrane protein YdfJ with MMPL/SSD domain